MTTEAINNLRTAIMDSPSPLLLNRAFLVSGLNDPNVIVPEDFDENLIAGFQLGSETGLSIEIGQVESVIDDSFKVIESSISFFGTKVTKGVKMVFTITGDETPTLTVKITTAPNAGWNLGNLSPYMTGWPFSQLTKISAVQFVFSTVDGKDQIDGAVINLKAGKYQSFISKLVVPSDFATVIELVGATLPSSPQVFAGTLDYSQVDGESVLYPTADIRALIGEGIFELFYLKNLKNPIVGLMLPAPVGGDPSEISIEPDEDEVLDQSPSMYFGLTIEIDDVAGKKISYELRATIILGGDMQFDFAIAPNEDSALLSPATALALFDNQGSYLTQSPPIVQQYLALIGLRGLTLSGQLGSKPTLDSLGMVIGSDPSQTWTVFDDSTNGFAIEFKEFYVDWSILNPLTAEERSQSVTFFTSFDFPESNPLHQAMPGVFEFQFSSELQLYANYVGTVDLNLLLESLTAGTVILPTDVASVKLSDLKLALDFSSQSYSFSSGLDAELNFLTINNEPILSIEGGQLSLAAKTATQNDSKDASNMTVVNAANNKTLYSASFSGLMKIGDVLYANVAVGYDGFQDQPRWDLAASLAKELSIDTLVEQFFDPGTLYEFPTFFPGNLTVNTLSVDAIIPSGQGELKPSYTVETTLSWTFDLGSQKVGIDPAKLKINYDGSKSPDQQFSGMVEGTWVYEAINLELLMGYELKQTDQGSNQILYAEWEGFRAEYQDPQNQIVFSLKGWSIGTLIQALVRTLGNPYFVLHSPWDLLNQVSLDGLNVNVSLESGVAFSQRLSASYELSKPIELGFINIKGIKFFRTTEGKVNLALDATIPSVLKDSVPPEDQQKLDNLTNTNKGQDTEDLPSIPGRGQEYFKLFLLVLGQRVGITGSSEFKNTKEVICALANVPNTTGKDNPVNPNANQGSPEPGLPYYDQGSNWLIAAHMGILKVADAWTIDAMLVFNDPNLYGMRLALAGPKAAGLAGLSIDVLYKKITDDIGVFQIEFTFPDSIRNLNFGAVSITLPEIGIKIYTNGDFFIDIGFPYNLDFRRSFSIAAIIYGVPVLGSGGFYFGKLSNDTATQIPTTDKGTFDPVIVFGLGLQLGLGYNFTKGPLSAGFALTVFGIVEGVFAPWHPYNRSDQNLLLRHQRVNPENGLVLASDSALQGDNYFKISGTVGIIGLLYGKIDFAIIQASLNVKITLSLQITYESYRAIPLIARVTVDVSLKVKINLGIFSITISLSFSANVSAKFVIGDNRKAPWDPDNNQIENFLVRKNNLLGEGPPAIKLCMLSLKPRQKQVIGISANDKPTLNLLISPPSTILAPEGATEYSQQQGAFALLMAMDAPDATSEEAPTGTSSFDHLCQAFFPWVIDALKNSSGDTVNLNLIADDIINRGDLECYIERLAYLDNPPLDIAGLLGFLQSAFKLNIQTPQNAKGTSIETAMQAGSTVFPVFDGLSLSIPNPAGSGDPEAIEFEKYATATSAYRKAVSAIFADIQALIDLEDEPNTRQLAADDDAESMAAVTFVDAFLMIGRQLLQAAFDLLENYAFPLATDGSDSIQSIISLINSSGNNLDVNDVAVPNKNHALSPGIQISIDGLAYSIQAKDTLASIAALYTDPAESNQRWITTAQPVIECNGMARIIQPNVMLLLKDNDNQEVPYLTGYGDYFDRIAKYLDISLSELASQSTLYDNISLLSPAAQITVPSITYTTATAEGKPSTDTLDTVAIFFNTTVSHLADTNLTVSGLFSPLAEDGYISLANLEALQIKQLWSAIQTTDQVAQTAGMVSRFMMFGLRLPNLTGLTLSDEFLYPSDQTEYALYQLTGQQFPTPASSNEYGITISRAAESHGVNLDFIMFNGTSDSSANIDLTEAYDLMTPVLEFAQAGEFLPSPDFEVEPLVTREPQDFAINLFSYWSTSDYAQLKALTARSNPNQSGEDGGTQTQATLWPLPTSLFNMIESRQASLEAQFSSLVDLIPLLPNFQPQVGSTSPATNVTSYQDIENWAWTTRVDFEVKKIPASIVASNQGTGEEAQPQGPATVPALSNVYEMVGPTSADALRLEQLLTAMDALGEDLISSVSLLYQSGGDTAAKLITLSQDEFLAFITQTNLSTETNPERSALLALANEDKPPVGIANSPGEFIKLLWELSVVRSGGYYLYYQVVDGGDGLPASVFDSSSAATLSMVVTYNTKTDAKSPDKALLNCVNSFVTTDNIGSSENIVRLASEAPTKLGTSAPLSNLETLTSLSAIYGPGPGRIAESNALVVLTNDVVITISGIVRQLLQKDLTNPADTLKNLANYYSVDAQQAITAEDIQNFNPGVTIELGAVFYIPTVNYVVTAASIPGASPGDTFTAMSKYYGLSIDELVVLALNVVGIFPENSQLKIDSQLFDLRSTLGPGNIGMKLCRANLGEPDPNEPSTYPEKYLYQMYNTLSAGVQKNVYFKQSPFGLPFGPQAKEGSSAEEFNGSHAELRNNRRNRLQTIAADDYTYSQALGFGNYCEINAAPKSPEPGLPAQSANPYIGVGSTAQVSLRWQDILGNTTITPFTKEPKDYQGAINGEAINIRYTDRLIAVSNWPNVQASYIYSNTNDLHLELSLILDTSNYGEATEQNIKRAKKDLKLYQNVYFQLHQDYTGLGVPGISGNAVSMSVNNSLFINSSEELIDDEANEVRAFTADCVKYIQAYVDQTTLPSQPQKTILLVVSLGDIDDGNVIELDVELIFNRQALLTDALVAGLNDGLSVTSIILPQADKLETVAYTEFATAFESIFQTDQWEMKVGEGLRKTEQSDNQQVQQLWAARFGKEAGVGIYFNVGESANYYAPKPVAKSLHSQKVKIEDYKTDTETDLSFTGVDQNLWFQTCLDALDAFLVADYSSSAFILDKILGTDDPLKEGYLGKVLDAKQFLADTISATIKPVLSTSATDDSSLFAAAEKLRQQLLNQLGAAYKAGTVALFELTDVSGAPVNNPAGPPSLYGQPTGVIDTDASNQNYSLTPAKIPLGEIKTPSSTGEQSYEPRLAFVVTSKNLTTRSGNEQKLSAEAYVPLDLSNQITHLEFDRSEVQGITGGYVQSRWMQFVMGPFDYKLGNSTSNVPVVNRALPTPPTVRKQTVKYNPDTTEHDKLTQWHYAFDYDYQYAPGDAVQLALELNYQAQNSNTPAEEYLFDLSPEYATGLNDLNICNSIIQQFKSAGHELSNQAVVKCAKQDQFWLITDHNKRYKVVDQNGALKVFSSEPDLFSALAQFVNSYPDILADFNEYLRKIDAETPDQSTVDNAKKAVSTFQSYITNVADEYAFSIISIQDKALFVAPETVRVTFEVVLESTKADGFARTDIINLQIDGIDATWDSTTRSITNGITTLQAPIVMIDNHTYKTKAVGTPPSGVDISYEYLLRSDETHQMPYSEALAQTNRKVKLPELDVLVYQNAWSELYVQRNKILFPIEDITSISTTSDFLYQTPVVKFTDPVIPQLNYAAILLSTTSGNTGSDLKTALNDFFKALFSGGNGQTTAEVSLNGGFSFAISPNQSGLPRVKLPINMLPPTDATVDPNITPDFNQAVAETINLWYEKQQPTKSGTPQINFDLHVFGSSSSKQPLLVISDLYYEVKD